MHNRRTFSGADVRTSTRFLSALAICVLAFFMGDDPCRCDLGTHVRRSPSRAANLITVI